MFPTKTSDETGLEEGAAKPVEDGAEMGLKVVGLAASIEVVGFGVVPENRVLVC